jgi:signal transduction histidine kinase
MSIQESYAKIRPILQKRAANTLARAAGVREDFEEQLTKFFDLIERAVVSGDANWLDVLLFEWATTRTESDLEGGERNVTALLKQLITLSFDTARETLPDEEALELVSALMPIYLHSLERVMTYENESRVAYISNELKSQQKKIERLDRSKSNFVSVAAHEFKTPLTLVEGYAAMLSDSLPPESDQLHMLLQGIHNGMRRLRELVDDMVDVTLIDNNLMVLNFQPVWLSRSLNMMKADFHEIVKNRNQTLEIRSFPGAEELFFADPERIYQAIKNIISNAIKYTPDGGRITVDGRMMPGFIELTVTDTGIGISPENQDTIFEKFGQLGDVALHSSGKTKFKGGGPGLGLPIAKGIIEAHGGSIWVESEGYDEVRCPGATFHMLLPARSQPSDPGLAKLFGASGLTTDEGNGQSDNE